MKLAHLKKLSFPPNLSTQNCLSGLAARVNEVLSGPLVYSGEEKKVACWELIFLQSKVNGCSYRGDVLPHAKWQWPKNTWFQEKWSIAAGNSKKPTLSLEELNSSAGIHLDSR